ncbi:hypothetical protein CDL15_Pgr010076 [Punica granatum]|uniref:Uncharacterized protein n=1 Tax=Punica granatum TaxID=22663 RepID=A0A218X5M5_PUNGR|nr:hypothetical protein CDL15_Pgr010076 [Punica granatum]
MLVCGGVRGRESGVGNLQQQGKWKSMSTKEGWGETNLYWERSDAGIEQSKAIGQELCELR